MVVIMYVYWSTLIKYACLFWLIAYLFDFLAENSWKKNSLYIQDLLQNRDGMMKNDPIYGNTSFNWPLLLWKLSVFICTLIYFIIRFVVWIVYKLFLWYKNRKSKQIDDDNFVENQDRRELIKQIESLQDEKTNLRQKLEEMQVESNSLKGNLTKLTDESFSDFKQDVLFKEAQNLEIHLKEVTRDRAFLKNKLNNMEKNCAKLEKKFKLCQDAGDKNKKVTSGSKIVDDGDTIGESLLHLNLSTMIKAQIRLIRDLYNMSL